MSFELRNKITNLIWYNTKNRVLNTDDAAKLTDEILILIYEHQTGELEEDDA